MKKLVLIRHAKSSWANPLQSDFERPLNERGQHDAPLMAGRLKAAGIIPDRIIASPAKRAAQTARHIAKGMAYQESAIEWHEELYHCVPSVFEELFQNLPDEVSTLFIVAHNPGISEFATQLAGSNSIIHMPTCAIAGIEFDASNWSDVSISGKRLFIFDTPKKDHD